MRKIILVVVILVALAYYFFNPPRWWLNLTKKVEPTAEVGRGLVQKHECQRCHRIGGRGSLKAPNLEGITQNPKDPALVTLRIWLRNPKAIKRDTAMPNFHLSDSEIEALISYLKSLDEQRSGTGSFPAAGKTSSSAPRTLPEGGQPTKR